MQLRVMQRFCNAKYLVIVNMVSTFGHQKPKADEIQNFQNPFVTRLEKRDVQCVIACVLNAVSKLQSPGSIRCCKHKHFTVQGGGIWS